MSGYSGTAIAPAARLDAAGMSGGNQVALLRDPNFQALVRQRNGLAVALSLVILAIYALFIGLVAFDKPLLATKVAGTTSLGIVLGLAVIVSAFVLVAVYVLRANSRFDAITERLVREYGQ